MIVLPKSPNAYSAPVWNQLNNSDTNGSLYASFNLDLTENEGKVRLGKRLLINTNSDDIGAMNSYPCGFKAYGNSVFTLLGTGGAGNVYLKNNTTGVYPSKTPFAQVLTSNTPTDIDSRYSDLEVSNNALYVTGSGTQVYKTTDTTNGTTWINATTLASAGHANSPHMLLTYSGRTYMTDLSSKIVSWDASDVLASSGTNTCNLATNYGGSDSNVITFIRASSNRIWIGTINTNGGKGYIYEWDGATADVASKQYRMDSAGVLSCVVKDDVPYVMDVYGQLHYWNGGTFVRLAGLNRINNQLLYNPMTAGTEQNNRFIHPNGMSVIKGKINILINGTNINNTTYLNNTIEETIPSGIWEFDETKGLYHKHSATLSHAGGTITDYGQVKLSGVGALAEINNPSTDAGRDGTFLAGVSYYGDTTTVKHGIFYDNSNDTVQKGGYLITVKLPATDQNGLPSVQNMYNNVYTLYKKFLDANDSINIKYRKEEIAAVIATATWTSATTFTTTTDLSALTGYEVEPILGLGSGKTSHITLVVNNAGTYTVTVDETYTGATGTSQIRVQNWKKISDINYGQATYDQAGIGELSNWVQFKVSMIFIGKDELEKLIIINQNANPAN